MITVLGEALIDLIVDPRGEVASAVGGAPVNTARSIARLGEPVEFLGGVSTDAFGRRISSVLEEDGVVLALGRHVAEPTTLAIAELDSQGAATYRFLVEGTAAAALTATEALFAVNPESNIIHVGTLGLVLQPLAGATAAVVNGAPDTAIVMLDPNCRPRLMAGSATYEATLNAVKARADIIKVSGDDLAFLAPGKHASAAAADLSSETDAVVLFTDGANAVHVIRGNTDIVLEVPPVAVVDTVGAGDSFSGGVLAFWHHHGRNRTDLEELEAVTEAVRFGIKVAALTCQRVGADPPRAAEVPGGWS